MKLSMISPRQLGLTLSAILSAAILVVVGFVPMANAATESPKVTSISPGTRAGSGSQTVTLTGANLSTTSSVSFSSVAVTPSPAPSASAVSVTPPTSLSSSTTYVDVTLTTPSGSVTTKNGYNYQAIAVPSVSSLVPSRGPAAGYTAVSISGSGFLGATSVQFGTVNAISFTVNSNTSISAIAPAGTSAAVNVYVSTSAGKSSSLASYTYQGVSCELGDYFSVAFPYLSSTLTKKHKKAIREGAADLVTSGCDSVSVVRYNAKVVGSTTATHKSYIKLSRARSKAVRTYLETQLDKLLSDISVSYSTRVSQVSQNRKALDSRVSYRKVLGRVLINSEIGTVYGNAGPLGGTNPVTITGTGFTGATVVRFGNTSATSFTVNSDSRITAVAPAGSLGTVGITVITPKRTLVKAASYSYVGAPTITGLSTGFGPENGGTTVTISGTNFLGVRGVDAVKFGSTAARSYTVVSANQISAVLPAGSDSDAKIGVTVVAAGGSITSGGAFEYVEAPFISGITNDKISTRNPETGAQPGSASETVVITGGNFLGITSVGLQTTPTSSGFDSITTFDVSSAGTSITFTAPTRGDTGAYDFVVETQTGRVVLNDALSYGDIPGKPSPAPALSTDADRVEKLTFTWTAVSAPTNGGTITYKVRLYQGSTLVATSPSTSGLTVTFTDLDGGVGYVAKVTAYNLFTPVDTFPAYSTSESTPATPSPSPTSGP